MNDLLIAAQELQVFCESQSWKFCIMGGIAVLRWGESRVTRDIDLTLLKGFGNEDNFIERLLLAYPARISDQLAFGKHLLPLAELKEDPAILKNFTRIRQL